MRPTNETLKDDSVPYDAIADEYYDTDLHKTSRNFDQTTAAILASDSIHRRIPTEGIVLDVGAGRGRVGEYLGFPANRIVQLDSSKKMLALRPREDCLLQVLHRAERLPFTDQQFSCVAAFLCDAFLGLDFLSEAYRVLRPGGVLIGTTPAHEWGSILRREIALSPSSTRFVNRHGQTVLVPSLLVTIDRLQEMMHLSGFKGNSSEVSYHTLPADAHPISGDIEISARGQGRLIHDVPLLYLFVGTK